MFCAEVCLFVCVRVFVPALPGDGGAGRAENDPKRREGPEAFDLKTLKPARRG
jgi:hypothetical protein